MDTDQKRVTILINRFSADGGCPTGKLLAELSEDICSEAICITSDERYAARHKALWKRLFSDVGWMLPVSWLFVRMRHCEEATVVVTTDPPLFYLVLILIGQRKGFRVIVWCHDLFPEIAMRLGVIPRLIGEPLRLVRNAIFKRAWKVVSIGRCMQSYLQTQGIESVVITNWIDCTQVPVLPMPKRFAVGYPGRAGRIHLHEQSISDGIVRIAGNTDAQFYKNLGSATVHVVTLKQDFVGLAVPSKVYAALASGRPVLFLGPKDCEIARFLNEHRCGFPVQSVQEAEQYLTLYREQPDLVVTQGKRARQAVEIYADRKVCTDQWRMLLNGTR